MSVGEFLLCLRQELAREKKLLEQEFGKLQEESENVSMHLTLQFA